MSSFTGFLERKVMPVAARIAAQRHLQALRDGLALTMPLLIVGSLFLILGFIPIKGYPDFMAGIFGDAWQTKLLYPVNVTFDIMALIASVGIAYRLAEKYGVDAISAASISLATFLLVTPYKIPFLAEGANTPVDVSGIPLKLMGSNGLFVAIIIALLSTEIFRWIIQKKIVIKMPDGVPPAVSKAFTALIPGFFVILIFWLLRILVENTDYGSLHELISTWIGTPIKHLGGGLVGSLIAVFLVQLLWSCGLHGAAIVGGIMGPVWLSSMDANRAAYEAGSSVPHIFTQQFFDIFVYIGGSGSTLALVFAMVLFAKSQQMKSLGRLALPSGIFNINEPITFGMPIVMNPLMIIPFILTPLVLVLTTYLAMKIGFAPKPVGVAVPWTMPPVFGGYLATGGKIMGSVWQIICFLIGFAIYYPFFRIWDKQKYKEENAG